MCVWLYDVGRRPVVLISNYDSPIVLANPQQQYQMCDQVASLIHSSCFLLPRNAEPHISDEQYLEAVIKFYSKHNPQKLGGSEQEFARKVVAQFPLSRGGSIQDSLNNQLVSLYGEGLRSFVEGTSKTAGEVDQPSGGAGAGAGAVTGAAGEVDLELCTARPLHYLLVTGCMRWQHPTLAHSFTQMRDLSLDIQVGQRSQNSFLGPVGYVIFTCIYCCMYTCCCHSTVPLPASQLLSLTPMHICNR
jgi:hypothetical protein